MEQERLDELTEMRFRHFERFSSAMIESQQEMMRNLTQNTKQLARLERRVDNIEKRLDAVEKRMASLETRMERAEELLTLVLDDLAYIKEYLRTRE